ncbi:hypothetical protein AWP57_11455 [Escherichia coli]|nr:fimbria/pilus outer membrane usher protein [Escherichia coli]OKV69830.1 hypothetical protein AWP57_11455 [Escherichia coli]
MITGVWKYRGKSSFNEANTRNWDYNSRQKSEIQFNISQTIFDGVSLYASGSQQDYWGNNDKNRNISVGVSGQQWGVGYSLNYQYSRYTDQNNDRALSLNRKRKANAVCNTCSLQTKLELLLN